MGAVPYQERFNLSHTSRREDGRSAYLTPFDAKNFVLVPSPTENGLISRTPLAARVILSGATVVTQASASPKRVVAADVGLTDLSHTHKSALPCEAHVGDLILVTHL